MPTRAVVRAHQSATARNKGEGRRSMGLVRSVFLASAMMLVTVMGAFAQTVPLTGQLVSRSVSFTPTSTSDSAVVYVTPATGSFVLTQFCSSGGLCSQFGLMLSDDVSGFIATSPTTTIGSYRQVWPLGGCLTFSPGFA